VLDLVVVVVLIGVAFAAGYFTRGYVSRQRRAEARRWREYAQTKPEWLGPAAAANTNEAAAPVSGELGQMLTRWESRARARRAG
jgi:hypothetical protein